MQNDQSHRGSEGGSPNPHTVMLVDDDERFKLLLRKFVERRCELTVVDTASSAEQALVRVGELRPSFVLLDVCMTGMSGLEAIELIKARSPSSTVIVVSSMPVEYGTEAEKRGADGYVQKKHIDEQLPDLLAAHR